MPCYYCNIWGHNIRHCNSPQIEEHYNTIRTFYENISDNYYITERMSFISYVDLNFDTKTIKAIGLKYIGSILLFEFTERTLSKDYIIKQLWEHFNYTIGPTRSISSHLLTGNELPIIPDEVPAYAQDLLSWNIDRMPDTIDTEILIAPDYEFYSLKIKSNYNITLSLEKDLVKEDTEDDCCICYELTKDVDNVHLNCGHKFCVQCIKGCLNSNKAICAVCRCPMKNFRVKNEKVYQLVSNYCIK